MRNLSTVRATAMTKHYKKEDITVVWKPELCTHSAICARGLNSVFKPREKPWIQPEGASKEEIVQQVLKCPSKALSILEMNSSET
jgi:uncharacterized Fe-S cluster protein YjdI